MTVGNLPESPSGTPLVDAPDKAEGIRLRLYLAGVTPNSQRAEANLDAALREFTGDRNFELEYIDVLLDTKRALADSVIVTPTLVAIGRKSRLVIIGDLGEYDKLSAFLNTAARFE